MKTIWKKTLTLTDQQTAEVPEGAEFLHVQCQHQSINVWFRCDPKAKLVERTFAIVGTGHPAPEPMEAQYIGTAEMHGGDYIWHVFVQTD